MSEIDFGQDFNRKGEKINLYGSDYASGLNERKPVIAQGYALQDALKKNFGNKVSLDKIYKWKDELIGMESFEFMNVNYVSVALILLDEYEYELSVDSFFNVFKQIFKSESIMNKYYEILIEKGRRKVIDIKEESRKLYAKQFLFNYIYKIINYRERNMKNIYKEDRTVKKRNEYKYGGEE